MNLTYLTVTLFPHQWLSCTLKQWEATNGKKQVTFNFSRVGNFLVDAHPTEQNKIITASLKYWHKKRPPIQNTKIFPVKALQLEPLVNDRNYFLGLTVDDFPLFLTSFKRPLDVFSKPYFRYVHYVPQNIRRPSVKTYGTTRILTQALHAINHLP